MSKSSCFVHRVILLVLTSPVLHSVAAQQPQPAFEVASVRLAPADADPQTGFWSRPGIGRFTASHVSLTRLIQLGYGIDESQIANGPDWIHIQLYDIDARPQQGVSLTREELRPCLQNLLKDRFHLVAHMEPRSQRGYSLVIGRDGPRLRPASDGHFAGERHPVSAGHLHTYSCSMQQLAQYLSSASGFPVMDRTGLTASYDIDFDYSLAPDSENDLPSLEVALKKATGLLLKPQRVSIEALVIDSVDRVPTAN